MKNLKDENYIQKIFFSKIIIDKKDRMKYITNNNKKIQEINGFKILSGKESQYRDDIVMNNGLIIFDFESSLKSFWSNQSVNTFKLFDRVYLWNKKEILEEIEKVLKKGTYFDEKTIEKYLNNINNNFKLKSSEVSWNNVIQIVYEVMFNEYLYSLGKSLSGDFKGIKGGLDIINQQKFFILKNEEKEDKNIIKNFGNNIFNIKLLKELYLSYKKYLEKKGIIGLEKYIIYHEKINEIKDNIKLVCFKINEDLFKKGYFETTSFQKPNFLKVMPYLRQRESNYKNIYYLKTIKNEK